ncbi:MAG: hypothetical protein P1Q69_11125 [Candidatus Thorarchaeota archaeon]|nr:hypothetical protein [Candidatus Thorarchaeota archaeon]
MGTSIRKKLDVMELIILAVTLYVAGYLLLVSFSGQIWNVISPQLTAISLTLLISSILATASMIFAHCLIHYFQQRSVRYLVLLLMAFDAVIVSIMFLVSHPSFDLWSPFADRNRNRSIAIAWGMVLMVSGLAGAFSGEAIITLKIRIVSFLSGIVLFPLVAFWFLLSREPVFVSTEPSGGLGGLTATGWIMILVLGVFMSISFLKYLSEWLRTRNRVLLASTSAMFFWLFALVLVVVLENPYQFAEIIWVGSVATGFALIAIAMLSTAIIEPRKQLENTVAERTKELSDSKQESEFYLGIWTHKMGNLLQGLLVYLDLLQIAEESGSDTGDHRRSAMEIAREATLLNAQVTKLSQAKDAADIERKSVSLARIISNSMDLSSKLLNPDAFRINFRVSTDVNVLAEEMLDVAILSLLSFFVRTRLHEELHITITYEKKNGRVITRIDCVGDEISSMYQEFLESQTVPQSPTIELDLYVARTLVELFDGTISYERLVSKRINRFSINLEQDTEGTMEI